MYEWTGMLVFEAASYRIIFVCVGMHSQFKGVRLGQKKVVLITIIMHLHTFQGL